MKTIEESAREHIGLSKDVIIDEEERYYNSKLTLLDAYLDGVKFAQRWIPIDEDYPLCYKIGDWDGKCSDFVIAKDNGGEIHVARLFSGVIDGREFENWYSRDDYELVGINSWRYIELL